MQILVRRASAFAVRTLLLFGLFVLVVLVQVALTTGLVASGLAGGLALLISGAVICLLVGAGLVVAMTRARRQAETLEADRVRYGLPDGPCCVIWESFEDQTMPWTLAGPIKAHFPAPARRLGVEGYAIVEFEIGADGVPKGMHCVDVWPAPLFYDAAVAAMGQARFTPIPGLTPRMGASYRVPFIFRIRGATHGRDRTPPGERLFP